MTIHGAERGDELVLNAVPGVAVNVIIQTGLFVLVSGLLQFTDSFVNKVVIRK